MQTAKSTLKFKVPVSVVTPILKKQGVVFDKQVVAQAPKLDSAKLTGAKSVKPSVSHNKTQEAKIAKEQIKAEKAKALAEEQKAALKAKLARWKEESKQILKLLQSKYPLCFSIPAKPLAIGISKEVIVLEQDNFSKQQSLYDTTIIKKQNIDTKTENNITYNYKRRREELNKLVKNHIAKQKQKLTQKNTDIAR